MPNKSVWIIWNLINSINQQKLIHSKTWTCNWRNCGAHIVYFSWEKNVLFGIFLARTKVFLQKIQKNWHVLYILAGEKTIFFTIRAPRFWVLVQTVTLDWLKGKLTPKQPSLDLYRSKNPVQLACLLWNIRIFFCRQTKKNVLQVISVSLRWDFQKVRSWDEMRFSKNSILRSLSLFEILITDSILRSWSLFEILITDSILMSWSLFEILITDFILRSWSLFEILITDSILLRSWSFRGGLERHV